MPTFRIGVDVGAMIPDGSPLSAELFPVLSEAVRVVSETAWRTWQDYAAGETMPNGKQIKIRSGTYLRSIALRQLGPFDAEVYSDLPYAKSIEEGTRERDLHDMLGSSLNTRRTKDGRRYLIIPFRWFSSGSVASDNQMPQSIQNWWKSETPSHIIGHSWRESGTHAVAFRNLTTGTYRQSRGDILEVRKRRYTWGARLDKDTISAAGVTGKNADRMAGMVNFRKPRAKGGGSHSQYMTFRVMVEGGKGWKVPAREGMWPARTTADQLRPDAERIFGEAVKRDLQAILDR